MTTPAPAADEKEPLRPLMARIWRDYLSHHKAALFTSIACAAVVGIVAATVLQLLEPAIDGLFLSKPVTIWKIFTIPPEHALVFIPSFIVGMAVIWTLAALGQAALVNRLGHGIVGDIQVRLFGAMIRADLARLRSQPSGPFGSSVSSGALSASFSLSACSFISFSIWKHMLSAWFRAWARFQD